MGGLQLHVWFGEGGRGGGCGGLRQARAESVVHAGGGGRGGFGGDVRRVCGGGDEAERLEGVLVRLEVEWVGLVDWPLRTILGCLKVSTKCSRWSPRW